MSGPCDCFLWREEAEGTALLRAADVDLFLIVDGGEGRSEASGALSWGRQELSAPSSSAVTEGFHGCDSSWPQELQELQAAG